MHTADRKSIILQNRQEAFMKISTTLFYYLIFTNLVGFLLMGRDKQRAKARKWRIPERTLFFTALAGGSIGSILGMQIFRHKTRHTSFVVGMPCILTAQILLGIYLYYIY